MPKRKKKMKVMLQKKMLVEKKIQKTRRKILKVKNVSHLFS